MFKNIQHLVVLMMENRSFDHAVGFLKSPTYKIDGLDGNETNPDSLGALVRVSPDAHYSGDLTPDPGHDFISVNEQIFGNSQGTGTATMQGFVKAYQGKTNNVPRSHNVMRCFKPGRLPALATLAREFAICDRWFASVPGPTIPNRAFAYGATSLGRVDMNPNYLNLLTVFERLDQNAVSSKIYYNDWCLGLANGYILKNARKFLFFFDDFLKDAKKNKLPSFSFIEPRYNDFTDRGQFFPAADQHPDHNVFEGEKVIKAVYDAIRSNQQTWESTLLLITYDEHGGLYDHVPPPATVSPDATPPPGQTVFKFDRLGVRVPAVLVSPFIPRGTIIRDKVFDHTSLIATARKLFLADFANSALTERDRHANTFEDCLTLPNARPNNIVIPQPSDSLTTAAAALTTTAKRASARAESVATAGFSLAATADLASTSTNPLNDFQASMVHQAYTFDILNPMPVATMAKPLSAITTEQDAAEYLGAIRKRIEQSRKGRRGKAGTKQAGGKPARKTK